MDNMNLILIGVAALFLLQIIALIVILFKERSNDPTRLTQAIFNFQTLLKDELERSRNDSRTAMRENREEVSGHLKMISDSLLLSLKTFDEKISSSAREDREEQSKTLQQFYKEMGNSFKSFEEKFSANVRALNDLQKEKFEDLMLRHHALKEEILNHLGEIRSVVENRLDAIQRDNSDKLEKMRATVDEKLHETLEKRLGESFKQVSDRLEQVHKGLGEMQSLAQGVGDLKRVLSNVKTRGVLGEIQLGAILESILSPNQFEKNVATVPDSPLRVEYAVKLPGAGGGKDSSVYLPVDSKFPMDIYSRLMDAYELADPELIDKSRKELYANVKSSAQNIKKYISPPDTTDFAILFLPVEGLYSEVVRNHEFFEQLQRDYKIIVTGPTTLSALLNSLQMGFKTLAIEKRSAEVWKILGAVKHEFGKFGDVLDKTRKKLGEASVNLDDLVGTRTNKIQATLRNVELLDDPSQTSKLLNMNDSQS